MRRKYDENFKKNAVKLSDASNKSVSQVAQDLGISNGMLYRWRQKYTAQGDKPRFATREEAAQGVFTFINGFYNTRRIQKRLGYLSPLEWLNRSYNSTLEISA